MGDLKFKIGGKERGFKIGLGFLEKISIGEKLSIQEVFDKFQNDTFFFIPKMLFYSTLYFDERLGNSVDYTIDSIYDWVDEIGINDPNIARFSHNVIESIKVHIPKSEGKPEPQKKIARQGKK